MKVLLISNMYPTDENPGYGVFVKNFENSMESRGISFDKAVICGRSTTKIRKFFAYLKFFLDTYRLVLFKKYDAIYVHYLAHSLLPISLISPLKKLNIIVNAHGEDLLPRSRFERALLKINSYCIEKASLIVVPSSYFKSIAESIFKNPRVFVSPSGGIDLNTFKPSNDFVAERQEITLGYISRIDHGKGWDIFLDAFSYLKSRYPSKALKAIVVGEGAQTEGFKKKIIKLELSDSVDYRGAVPHKNLPKIYSELDLFVFPTTLRESLGLVGLESLACGTPAICSSIGGIKTYMIDGVNGYTFSPGSHLELASKIEKYIELSTSEVQSMRTRALETALNYCHKKVADELISKIKEATQHES